MMDMRTWGLGALQFVFDPSTDTMQIYSPLQNKEILRCSWHDWDLMMKGMQATHETIQSGPWAIEDFASRYTEKQQEAIYYHLNSGDGWRLPTPE